MHSIHINLGSNVNRRKNIGHALQLIAKKMLIKQTSSCYETPAEGFVGDNFYNVGVDAQTDQSIEQIIRWLRDIENTMGRNRNQPKFSDRCIDLDLVLYGDLIAERHNIPRDDILKYAFVLKPLAELRPDEAHPTQNLDYQTLWRNFKKTHHPNIQAILL